jgi:hypothetical protein
LQQAYILSREMEGGRGVGIFECPPVRTKAKTKISGDMQIHLASRSAINQTTNASYDTIAIVVSLLYRLKFLSKHRVILAVYLQKNCRFLKLGARGYYLS